MNWISKLLSYMKGRNLQKEKADITASMLYILNNLKNMR